MKKGWSVWLELPAPVRIVLVIAFFILVGMMLPSPVRAGPVELVQTFASGAELRLIDRPCSHAGTLALIKEDQRTRFRDARATIRGRLAFACWLAIEDKVGVLFEDGSTQVYEQSDFKVPATI